jgi:hypothetical protein
MDFFCLIQRGYIGLRFLHYKTSPLLILVISSTKLLSSSEVQRIRERIRYMRAITRIDFVSVYGLLHDLLR